MSRCEVWYMGRGLGCHPESIEVFTKTRFCNISQLINQAWRRRSEKSKYLSNKVITASRAADLFSHNKQERKTDSNNFQVQALRNGFQIRSTTCWRVVP
jgi:hypothetical protein